MMGKVYQVTHQSRDDCFALYFYPLIKASAGLIAPLIISAAHICNALVT